MNEINVHQLFSLNILTCFIHFYEDRTKLKIPFDVLPPFLFDELFQQLLIIFILVFFQRGNQSVSRICKFIFVGIFIFLAISLIISLAGVLKYLDFLYFCSYVKLFITLIKYVPQAYLNFRRKSTFGWSIGNILLDFTGGFLSIGQMFVISYNESKFFIDCLLI